MLNTRTAMSNRRGRAITPKITCFSHAAAHIQDQARQRYLYRTDGFAGVTADTQALWSRVCLQAMVKRRHDQPDRAAVDIAKGVTADLLVGRADVRTGRAANAAQCVLEPGVGSHLAAPVIDEDDMHFFARSCRTGDKGRIARDLLGSRTAREQA